MNFIQVFSNFSVENCYTIGSRADIKRLNQRIENGFNTEKQSLQVAFGDVLEGSVFDQCGSSLTVPSMSKATAALHPVYNRDMRMYEQFCLVQDLVIEDLFKREVEQLTLVKDHVNNQVIYITDFHTMDKNRKNINIDYLFFASRMESIINLLNETKKKLDVKKNRDYLCIYNQIKEVGIQTLDTKKMLILKNRRFL